MALYDFPAIVFTLPHVICREDKRGDRVCHEAPKSVRVIIAEVGVEKPLLLVCDTVDGSTIEEPPSVIARIPLAEDSQTEIETDSSLRMVRFVLPKVQTFQLIFPTPGEFWDMVQVVAEIQAKRIENQVKEEELVRGVFGMVPSIPRVLKQEEE